MKKKVISRIGAAILTASVMMSMAVPIMAGTNYTPVSGTSCTFNKYLIMDARDTVPNLTFNFQIEPGTAIAANSSNHVMQVLPGVVVRDSDHNDVITAPSIGSVTFAPGNEPPEHPETNIDVRRDNKKRTGTVSTDAVQLDGGEKYVLQEASVSFAGITFPEPGIYRYIITETVNQNYVAAGITYDTDTDRVLDVYVSDDGRGHLVVSGYVLHTDAGNVSMGDSMGSANPESENNDKTDGFTNEMTGRKDLKIENTVSGNQASRDKWFRFFVKMENVNDADKFTVSNSPTRSNDSGNADEKSGSTAATKPEYRNQDNKLEVTGAELKAGVPFYLQGTQSVVIRGLPQNASYTVTEDAEDYLSSVPDGCTNSGVIGNIAGENKLTRAGFTNTRNGVIPTGVMVTIAPFAVATAIGGVGIASISMKKRKKEEE